MSLLVIQPGTLTTVQDGGRLGLAHLGIPPGGFMDQRSAHEANRLVGNALNTALLEVTWTGVELLAESNCTLAVAGAVFSCWLNDEAMVMDRSVHLVKGDRFKMGRLLTGVRAYVACAGGFDLPQLGGSHSTLLVAHMGGLAGRALQTGDRLPLNHPEHVPIRYQRHWLQVKARSQHVVRATPGPESNWFNPAVIRQAFGQAYQLTPECSRQGFRLQSAAIVTAKESQLNSSGLVPGTLQVTPDGQTILAMREAQTTGGYPRILVVNQDELFKLAQVRPGEHIHFFVGAV